MDLIYVPGVSEKFGITPFMSERDAHHKSYVDYDLFYIYLADVMVTIPAMVDFISKQYELNKYVYYSKAVNSPQYNATLMSDGRIEREAITKRAFGILLAAMDDSKLQEKICELFISVYPSMRKLKKSFSIDLYMKLDDGWFELARNSKWVHEAQRGFWFFGAYVVDHYHGLNGSENQGIILAKMCALVAILDGEVIDRKEFQKIVDRINIRDYIRTPANFREFKPLIQDTSDILNAIEILRKFSFDRYEERYQRDKKFAAIYDYLSTPEKKDEQIRIEILLRNLMDAMALAGKNTEVMIESESITEEELTRIYKIVARNYQFEQGESKRLVEIHASDYFLTVVIYQIMKTMKADRDFYYKNSSESRFFEMQTAEKENAELQRRIAAQAAQIEAMRQQTELQAAQIGALKAELLKDTQDATRDATKPLLAEISALNSRIADLQSNVEESNRQHAELYRLREFVFNMQQSNDIAIEEISLDRLLAGKRIYIFGGHINWRTKLKQKYPKLEVLDGHNLSFDEQKLIGADMVLLNTGNMSHTLYYKVIDVIRKHHISFDYIGKYSNPNLLEKEIAEALLRSM